MAVDPLQCAACAAPVPLVDGDHGTCPNCGAQYPIPETYRALRDEAAAAARKPEALALAKALGKPPPAIIRMLAVFSSTAFLFLGMGFFIAAGVTLSIWLMPWLGRHLFHVLTYDVLSANRQMQLSIVVPFGLLVIGFTVASWARKSGITLGGLQAALAAAPPAKPGGPKTCRQCGAPLAPAAGALTARCAYCQADNLVELPPGWIATMRAQAKTLTQETKKAAKVWETERRALRRSLRKRFVLWTAVLLVPMWFIIGAAAGKSKEGQLRSWQDAMGYRTETADCNEATDGIELEPTCRGDRCSFLWPIALRHGEVVRHVSRDLPAGSVVELQMHDETWFGDGWSTVASSPVSAGHPGATDVPYSGWYNLRVTVPQPVKKTYRYCVSVK